MLQFLRAYSQTCVQRPPLRLRDSGRCRQVVVVQRSFKLSLMQNGTLKWWSLKAGGRYSEGVVTSGLTVPWLAKRNAWLKIAKLV